MPVGRRNNDVGSRNDGRRAQWRLIAAATYAPYPKIPFILYIPANPQPSFRRKPESMV